jgi:hypothetical protein
MAAPRKSKTAGVRSGKAKVKAASNGATESRTIANARVANGNGGTGAPSAEMIRVRAYEVFLARGTMAGDELSDWLIAEREIMEKTAPHD